MFKLYTKRNFKNQAKEQLIIMKCLFRLISFAILLNACNNKLHKASGDKYIRLYRMCKDRDELKYLWIEEGKTFTAYRNGYYYSGKVITKSDSVFLVPKYSEFKECFRVVKIDNLKENNGYYFKLSNIDNIKKFRQRIQLSCDSLSGQNKRLIEFSDKGPGKMPTGSSLLFFDNNLTSFHQTFSFDTSHKSMGIYKIEVKIPLNLFDSSLPYWFKTDTLILKKDSLFSCGLNMNLEF